MKAKWKALVLAACIAMENMPVMAAGLEEVTDQSVVVQEETQSEEVETEEAEAKEAEAKEAESEEAATEETATEEAETEETEAEETESKETESEETETEATESEEVAESEAEESKDADEEEAKTEVKTEAKTKETKAADEAEELEQSIEATVDLSKYFISDGGYESFSAPELNNEEELLTYDAAVEDGFKNAVYVGFMNRSTYIDVESYGISVSRCKELITDLVNMYPQLFFVNSRFSYYYNNLTGAMTALVPSYRYEPWQQQQVESTVASIVNGMDPTWNNERKLLYLHDYLAMNITYDRTLSRHDVYQALIEHDAVCSGYSMAYRYLAMTAGIDVDVVVSDTINHAWNMYNAYGKRYFIDVTWDDLDGDAYYVYGDHRYFMNSKTRFEHEGADWIAAVAGDANNFGWDATEFDNMYWQYSPVPVPFIGDTTAYAYGDHINLRLGNGGEYQFPLPGTFKWYVWGSGNQYYGGKFISVVSAGGFYCFNSQDTIYALNTAGKIWPVYTLSDSERAKGYIYGLKAIAPNRVVFMLAHEYGEKPVYEKEIPASVLQEGDGIIINDTNFPDATFRKVVAGFDKNQSGKLTSAEIAAVTWLDCSSSKIGSSSISSLKGVAYFTNIAGLNCSGQKITSLDLSKNTLLQTVACSQNQLKSLDLSKNTKLTTLYCQNNRISSLKFPENSQISTLVCTGNKLTELKIEKYRNLKEVYLFGKETKIKNSAGTVIGITKTLTKNKENRQFSYDKSLKVSYGTEFLDVPSDIWYTDAVAYVVKKGYMVGTAQGIFAPDSILTREQFVKVLYNIAGSPKVKSKKTFSDVKSKEWYENAIIWAVSNKITEGVGKGKFGIGQQITREQLVRMLYIYASANGYDLSYDKNILKNYKDVKKVSSWATNEMKWAVTKKVVSGKPGQNGGSYLDPQGKASRAECARIVMNFLQNVKKSAK